MPDPTIRKGWQAIRKGQAEHGSVTRMTLEDVERIAEENNGEPSWVGDRLLIRCPVHEDNGPSLQATENGSRLLFHCFGACDDSDPEWLPTLADWLNDPSPMPPPKGGTLRATGNGKPSKGKKRRLPWWDVVDGVWFHGRVKPEYEEHRHPYRDQDGKVVALKLRYRLDLGKHGVTLGRGRSYKGMVWATPTDDFDHKDPAAVVRSSGVAGRIDLLRLSPPTGLGVTLGLNGRKEADLPLYRDGDLWDLKKGTTVYVCESESSVDTAWMHRIPATCAAGGASSKPPADLSALDDLDVVLVPDRDEAGERWLERWLERLPDAKVGRIPDAIEDQMRKMGKDPKGADLRDLLESPRLGIKDLDVSTAEEATQTHEPDDEPNARDLVGQFAVPTLGEDFWAARDVHEHIREAAWSEGFPPDALLGAVLARVSWLTDHELTLPGTRIGNLDVQVCLTSSSGDGKGTAMDLAERLIPAPEEPCICGNPDHDPAYSEVPTGSGEGLLRAYFENVEAGRTARGAPIMANRIDRRNVLIRMDEAEMLTTLAKRNGAGSTVAPILRQSFSGERLGFQYASDEKRRRIPPRGARMAVVMGIQPTVAGPLFDQAGGGTPQRMLWLGIYAPELSRFLDEPLPSWPGELPDDFTTSAPYRMRLDSSVHDEIRRHLIQRRAGLAKVHRLDTHRNLLRLKVAALLARLDGLRKSITEEDWVLAGMVLDVSDGVRSAVQAEIAATESKTGAVYAQRRATQARAVTADADRVQAAAYVGARKVHKDGSAKRRDFKDALGKYYRDVWKEALERALAQRLVVEDDGTLTPGEVEPPGGKS